LPKKQFDQDFDLPQIEKVARCIDIYVLKRKNASFNQLALALQIEVGAELLERKRDLLTRLVYERLKQYRALRKDAKAALETAYYWLGMTHTRMGSRSLQQAALGLKPPIDVKILPRSRIGVQYPAVTAERIPLQPVGLMDPIIRQFILFNRH
jgi:V/A-type H+-transporting ATPase subunit D